MELPLEHVWTFWSVRLEDHRFCTSGEAGTVQEFWARLRESLADHDEQPVGTSLHIFKRGIKPLWEDPRNMIGGHFQLTMKARLAQQQWLRAVLALVGEQFPLEETCGITLLEQPKGRYVMKLWLSSTDKEQVDCARQYLVALLGGLENITRLTFVKHKLVLGGARKELPESFICHQPVPLRDGCSAVKVKSGRL
eukprot:NODE_2580_length_899_cov_114.850588_g2119_i0.p1 GENE.NODE_2580_length_899_cov_114.850588_g2119_i0~~NODE_2580_length_899_cov_114.850588_g2119_i0.p1  ORF type:complete len:195 (+),score=35.78 NODE_2580_length_899_cov_114.850588_g2119_i0:96-680(+)